MAAWATSVRLLKSIADPKLPAPMSSHDVPALLVSNSVSMGVMSNLSWAVSGYNTNFTFVPSKNEDGQFLNLNEFALPPTTVYLRITP